MRTFTQKLAFLLVVMLCSVGIRLQASDLTVADGTATSNYLPVYGMYVDTEGSHQQCLYPAALLSEMAGGSISQMTFYLSSPATAAWTGAVIQVSLGESSETSLSSSFITDGLTAVYTGSLDATQSTMVVAFDNAFDYAGGNLVVDFEVVAAGTWKGASFYGVSDVSGLGRYRTSSGSGTPQDFLPKVTFDYENSGEPRCEKPSSLEISGIGIHDATISWDGVSAAFNVDYKKASAEDWTSLLVNSPLRTTQLANLDASTAYQVRVQGVCEGMDPSSWRIVSFKTANGIPFVEDFNASSSLPAEWAGYSGLLANILAGSAQLSPASGWSISSSSTSGWDNHLRANIYGSSSSKWIVSPSIMLEGNAQLSFVLAITGSSFAPLNPGSQDDDLFVVLISTDDGATWSILRQWDNAGSAYVYDNVSSTGEEVIIDLSSYAGQSAKIAFYGESTSGPSTGNGDNYHHIDEFRVALPATCLKPTELAVVDGSLTANSAEISWTENNSKSDWKIQYKKASATEWSTIDAAENPFTLSNLESNTTYNLQVATVCGDEDISEYTKPISFTTAIGLPFEEPFATTETPAGWSRYSGLVDEILAGSASLVSGYSWSIGTSNSALDGNHLYLNIYGSSCNYWFVSPSINLDVNAQLSFDLALTKYSGTSAPVDPSEQQDDRFIVLVSSDEGASWTILREWNNNGSDYSYNAIATEGEEVVIDLSDYNGSSIKFAFYGESTASGGDNNIHVDNIVVEKIPTCFNPLSPKAIAYKNSAEISWVDDDRSAPVAWILQYKKAAEEAWATLNISENPYILEGLEDYTAYDVRVAADCGGEDVSKYSKVVSFKTAAGVPYAESFVSMPADWNRFIGLYDDVAAGEPLVKATSGWTVAAGNGVYPDSAAHLKLQIAGDAVKNWIVSPAIMIEDNVRITFDLALTQSNGSLQPVEPGYQDDDKFYLLASSDGGESWEILKGWGDGGDESYEGIPCTASGQTIPVDLSEHAGESMIFAFYGESTILGEDGKGDNMIHISDVRVDYIPDCQNSSSLSVQNIEATVATVVWDEEEGAQWQYGFVANPAADFAPAEEDFANNTGNFMVALDNLTENTPYIFFLRRNCGGVFSAVKSIRFRTIQEPASLPFADDFEDGEKWLFVNGELTNQWVIGNAVNNGGSHALYISKDGGASNQYDNTKNTMVYATKSFSFDEDATYSFSFDWRAYGESTYDYLRVALVPVTEQLVASEDILAGLSTTTLPAGWVALDGGEKLNQVSAWQHISREVSVPMGLYNVVFAWRSDHSTGNDPAAAIDNFSLSKLLCPAPTNLHAVDASATTSSVDIEWNASSESNWIVEYKKVGLTEWTRIEEPVTANPFTLSGLDASTSYEVRVAAWCDPEDEQALSEFSAPVVVATSCGIISAYPWSENFDNIAGSSSDRVLPSCWSAINTTSYEYYDYYPTVYPDGYSTYSNSAPNSLALYSYAYSSSYDPQDQYAILPQMEDISGLRIKFNARARETGSYSSADATFHVGVMSDPDDASTFVEVQTIQPTSTAYAPFEVKLNTYEGAGQYIAFKLDAADPDNLYIHGAYIDDIVIEELPSCLEPEGPITVSDITASGASFSWPNEEAAVWKYAIALASEPQPADENFVEVSNNSVAIESGLNENSDYIFYLRRECGANLSPSISAAFHTKQLAVAVPFADNFEEGNNWYFINGANGWVIGADAHNGEGSTHAMYISNDGATSGYNTSSSCVSYATKRFSISEGTYVFTYDWTAGGESTYDYLRVALVPDSLDLPANFSYTSSLPTGWKALDGGSKLNLSTGWQSYASGEIAVEEGIYKMVFVWRNDGGGGTQPGAAIDNFAIRAISCSMPANVQIANFTANSVDIAWTSDAAAAQIVYSTEADFNPAEATIHNADVNPFTLAMLDPETTYYLYLRADCGSGEFSDWTARLSFTTKSACEMPTGLVANDLKAESVSIAWEMYGLSSFNLSYSADGENWIDSLNVVSPLAINGLSENTSYRVKVQPSCNTEAWSSVLSFTTPQIPASVPFTDDFEDGNKWVLVNGTITNKWAYGEAVNNGGSHALYISNDGGASNAYTLNSAAMVYASKIISIEEAGTYSFSYDWMANGESNNSGTSAYDYLRVALAPADADLKASSSAPSGFSSNTLPEGWIALDGGEWLNGVTTWQSKSVEVAVEAGQYKLVLAWRDDTSSGNQTPAAVDNFSIAKRDCPKPTAFEVTSVASRSAVVAWSSEASSCQIALGTTAGFSPSSVTPIEADANPFTLENLEPATTYYAYVRAICDENFSDWSDRIIFTTLVACPVPTGLEAILTAGEGSIATLNWNAGEASDWVVEYSLNSDFSDPVISESVSGAASLNLENLTPEATYYARVKAVCGGDDGESEWSAAISFVPTNALNLTINDGTVENAYIPLYGLYADEANQKSQFIIPAETLASISGDTILNLTFYSSSANVSWPSAEFEVYMAEVDATTISAFNDWNTLSLVKSAGNLSVVDHEMAVQLTDPYKYNGGNLLIGFTEPVEATDYKSCSWYGVAASSAAYSMYGNSMNVGQRNFLPKMTIGFAKSADPTAISNTGDGIDGKAVKFIRNENVFILVNGVIYDATGRKVEVVK